MEVTSNEKWVNEYYTPSVLFSIKVKEHILSMQSDFQKIDVYDSYEFGRFFMLDGFLMLTQKDEHIYHEMISHIPMAVNPQIKNVLIIGGGDGGSVREFARYAHIEQIDLVEIDGAVVDICKKYFPFTACGFADERVNVYIQDGINYVKECKKIYDLIIVDSTDPIGVGEGLFNVEFYKDCHKLLSDNGILINQHESPYYAEDAKQAVRAHKNISSVFEKSYVYQFHMPTYASGHWLFGFASKGLHPIKDLDANKWEKFGIKTKYYNTKLHVGSFYLPTYVLELLKQR